MFVHRYIYLTSSAPRKSTALRAAFVATATYPGVSIIPCGVWMRPTLAWLLVDSCKISNRKKSRGSYAQSGKSLGPRSVGGGGGALDTFDFLDENNRDVFRVLLLVVALIEYCRIIVPGIIIENAATVLLLAWNPTLHDSNMVTSKMTLAGLKSRRL